MNLPNLVLFALTRCIACDLDPPTTKTFPVCETCENALLPGLNHRKEHYSLFQLTDSAYPVLKKWKTRRAPLFDRAVLKRVDHTKLKDYLNEKKIQAVIPVPQNYQRSWKMGGSPAFRIARFVSQVGEVPLRTGILNHERITQGKRQAELPGWQRIQTHLHFATKPNRLGLRSVLIVDDFSTTGHTLNEATRVLKASGYGEIYTLCLGTRNQSSEDCSGALCA